MSCQVLYRLPHKKHYVTLEQKHGEPLEINSLSQLNEKKGFVVAPFQASDEYPILLIRPDVVFSCETDGHIPADLHFPPAWATPYETIEHRDEYMDDFSRFHSQLINGRFSKLVLAREATLLTEEPVDPKILFFEACHRYPRLFIALVSMPDGTSWLTATPEILLEGIGEEWRTIALAGTMQLEGDELLGEGENIRWSPKNIQEQRYVANYIGECLKGFSIDFKEEGPYTVRAAHLVHLRSDFCFKRKHLPIGNLLEVLHPTPAVCGLPKKEAYNFIIQNEYSPREYYSGFMGPLGIDDATHLYVSLRCLHTNGTEHHLQAGGGLLKESLPEQEWQETQAKMQAMRSLFYK
jgi:isochorismate synthase